MSSEISFDAMQIEIQENLIKLINNKVSSPRIRFLAPDERIHTDDELCEMYDVYNIFVDITYSSKRGAKPLLEIYLGKDFGLEAPRKLGLSFEIQKHLRAWGRNAANTLSIYFLERDCYYLGKMRIDLITEDKENFCIPNLYLNTNIFLYENIVQANSSHNKDDDDDPLRIPIEKYVNEKMEDRAMAQAFYLNLKNAKNNHS